MSPTENDAHIQPEAVVAPRFALGPVPLTDVCYGIAGLLFVQYWAGVAAMVAASAGAGGIVEAFGEISVLPVVEWYVLFGMIRGLKGPDVPASLALSSLLVFVLGSMLVHHQRTAFVLEALLLVFLWIRTAGLGRVSFIVLLIALQLDEGLKPLHGLFSAIDAHILPVVMAGIGQPVVKIGNLIRSPGLPDGLVLLAGCASTKLMLPMGLGFTALVLGSHERFMRSDWRWLGLVLAAAIIMNIVRLCLMLQSHAAFESWHVGTGASIVSVAGLVVTLVAWFVATGRDGTRAP